MNIGIVGSGNVGGTLGTRWSSNGHRVIFSSRNPESEEMQELAKDAKATAATTVDAVKASEVVLLSTPWPATQEALSGCGPLAGKILIDATNPLLPDLSGLSIGTTNSGGEQVAAWSPGARVVKAFNTVGYNVMHNPTFADGPAVLFYCGDDAAAKATVKQLATELGFDPHDAGPLTQARVLEPFAQLWISLAVKYGFGRDFAFHLLRR